MIHPILAAGVNLQLRLNDLHPLGAKPNPPAKGFKIVKRCEVADGLKPLVSWIAGEALGVADTFAVAVVIIVLSILVFIARTRLGKSLFVFLIVLLIIAALLSVVPQLLASFPGLANSC